MARIHIQGAGSDYDCAAHDTVLRAALRAGVGFPYECNVGSCGSCRFQVIEGEVENLWSEAPGLSPRDLKKNRHLACQSRAVADCVIKMRPDPSAVLPHLPTRFAATLEGLRPLTHDLVEISLRGTEPAQFVPGQYALLALPGVTGLRAFSMSNIANDDGLWTFIIKRLPGGAGSAWLFDQAKVGSQLNIDGPYGHAGYRAAISRPAVCIAGGGGIGPMLSIVRGRAAASPGNDAVSLYYGGRAERDMIEPAVIAELGGQDGGCRYEAVASEPTSGSWTGATGFVHEHALAQVGASGALADSEYYMAGPPPMIDTALRALVIDGGVPVGQVHYDRFY